MGGAMSSPNMPGVMGIASGGKYYSAVGVDSGKFVLQPSPPAPAANQHLNCETDQNGNVTCQGIQLSCTKMASGGLHCDIDQYDAVGQRSIKGYQTAPVAPAIVQPVGMLPVEPVTAVPVAAPVVAPVVVTPAKAVVVADNTGALLWSILLIIIIIVIIVAIVKYSKKRQAMAVEGM